MIYSMDAIRVNTDRTLRIDFSGTANFGQNLATEDFLVPEPNDDQKCELVRKFSGNELHCKAALRPQVQVLRAKGRSWLHQLLISLEEPAEDSEDLPSNRTSREE